MDFLVLGAIRDVVIIVFFGLGTFLLLFLILIAFLIYRKIGGLMDAARKNLEATRITLGNLAAVSTMLTDSVLRPIITTYSVFAGVKRTLAFLTRLSKKTGGG